MDGEIKVDFWNVGQGDASSITRPDGSLDIIDVGLMRSPQLRAFLAVEHKKINVLCLTHNDQDHISGLRAILKMPNVVISRAYFLDDGHDIKTNPILMDLFDKVGVDNVARLERSPNLKELDSFGDYRLVVKYPSFYNNSISSTPNDTSAIICLTYKEKDVVVWGADAKISTIAQYVSPQMPCLFGPHHGAPDDSKAGVFEDNVKKMAPKRCFLSFGYKNRNHHPNEKYIRCLASTGCEIICCQRCSKCKGDGKLTIVDGDGFYGLLPPYKSSEHKEVLCCHGHVRLIVSDGKVCDELAAEYAKEKRKLPKRLCKVSQ